MLLPAINDTIVAVSSGWTASPIGVVRLSGPWSFALVSRIVRAPGDAAARPERGFCDALLRVGDAGEMPATILRFPAPRSYTGQDVVELHTPGCLPLLRLLCDELIRLGARRALPGEFTARAFLAGKLPAGRVGDVAAAIHADSESAARAAARGLAVEFERRIGVVVDRLAELLALIEAGIDFADEEDVSFVSRQRARDEVRAALAEIGELRATEHRERNALGFCVALAGLPNAGKSTLFNALVGRERAIVSPIVGTTRDVISAEIEIAGQKIVVQDTAGLGTSDDAISAAAHLAAEAAADEADAVVWVHDGTRAWDEHEARLFAGTPTARRISVATKADLRARVGVLCPGSGAPNAGVALPLLETAAPAPEIAAESAGIAASEHTIEEPAGNTVADRAISVCAVTGFGMERLRDEIVHRIQAGDAGHAGAQAALALGQAVECLERALGLLPVSDQAPMAAELIAAELRLALAALDPVQRAPDPEAVLGRIFATFCIGK